MVKDSRPSHGWRYRKGRPCRLAPHGTRVTEREREMGRIYFSFFQIFLKALWGCFSSKPYCWRMKIRF